MQVYCFVVERVSIKSPDEKLLSRSVDADFEIFLLNLCTGISSGGNVIVIREAPTTSSSESVFTDPENNDVDNTINLTITRLEQLNLVSNQPNLQIVQHEQLNFDGQSESEAEEMPIVKKIGGSGQQENGTDKGIFSVSRVKKVELPEIPLVTDICSAARKHPLELGSSHRKKRNFSQFVPDDEKIILLCDLLHVMFQR